MWYMFPVQCDERRIDHQTLLLVVTMPCACWFLWRTNHIEDFQVTSSSCNLGLRFEGLFGEVLYFEGPNHIWRALKTSILNTGLLLLYYVECVTSRDTKQGTETVLWQTRNQKSSGTLIPRPLYTLHLHRFATSIQVAVPAMAGENFGHNRSRPIPNVSKSNRWHVDIFRLFLSLVSSFMPRSHPTFATPKKGFLKLSSLHTIDII